MRRGRHPSADRRSGTPFVAHVLEDADLGLNGEAGRHGQPGVGHLRQAGAFAAEHVFHLAVAVGRAAAERINVFSALVLD